MAPGRVGGGPVGLGSPPCGAVRLSAMLGGTRKEIPCGVSIGIQESVEKLLEKIRAEVDADTSV